MSVNPETDALLEFISNSPSPYHAVDRGEALLRKTLKAEPLKEQVPFQLRQGQFYTVKRDGGSMLAFRMPREAAAKKNRALPVFKIIAAHTDSPCLKLKPRPMESTDPYLQWGVEVYGSPLFNSWLDRDLVLAGRLSTLRNGALVHHLVHLDQKPLRIPQLAIHLDREVNNKGLQLNPQRHLVPVLGLHEGRTGDPLTRLLEILKDHGTVLKVENLLGFDLLLADRTPPTYGGLNDEFIYAPRLDNLAMMHAALEAFRKASFSETDIPVIVFFNHEEVGSRSGSGALSRFLVQNLERIALQAGLSRDAYFAALAGSFMISADMAHAVHPNYRSRHEASHQIVLGGGPVLKQNAGLRYATGSEAALVFRHYAHKAGVPVQDFVNRSDLGCGSTLGPFVASQLGIPVVDAGSAMLSMHSAREMAGSADQPLMIKIFKAFFSEPLPSRRAS